MHPSIISYGSYSVKELPLHRNPGLEIVYVSEGVLLWEVDGRKERVPPRHFFFTLPWQAHGSGAFHEPGNFIHFVQFRLNNLYRNPVRRFGFHPSLHMDAKTSQRASEVLGGADRHTWPASHELADSMATLIKRVDEECDPLIIEGYFSIIIAEIVASLEGKIDVPVKKTSPENTVGRFLERLREKCEQEWSLSDMLKACPMGRSIFTQTVHLLTGDSPSDHLRRLRVEKAEDMLADTDMPVIDIAMECGFSSSQLFSRTFKKFTNRTPSQFRDESRNPSPPHVIDFTVEDEQRRLVAVKNRNTWI